MAKEKIHVEKIRIIVGRKVLELTPLELQELRDVLDATFPRRQQSASSQCAALFMEKYERPREKNWPHWRSPSLHCNAKTGGGVVSFECKAGA